MHTRALNKMFVGYFLFFHIFFVLGWLHHFFSRVCMCVSDCFQFVCFPFRFYAVLKYHTQNINFTIMNIITIIVFIYTYTLVWRVYHYVYTICMCIFGFRERARDFERERAQTHAKKNPTRE